MAFSSTTAPVECCPNAFMQWFNGGGTDATVLRYNNWGMYMLGVEDLGNTTNFDALVYPNPATYNVTVNVTLTERESLTIDVYSISGQLLHSDNMGKQQGEVSKQIDFSNFSNGVYILQVKTDSKMVSKKIIKHD